MEEVEMTSDVYIDGVSNKREFKDVMRNSVLNLRFHKVEDLNFDCKSLVNNSMFLICKIYYLGSKNLD